MGIALCTETEIDWVYVPDSEPGYPPPSPPRGRKDKVFDAAACALLDVHARRAKRELNTSYAILIDYLTKPAKNDIEKLRVIVTWFANQHIRENKYPNVKDALSPDGYMKTIKQGNGSHAAFLALLCRAAGLPCTIIRGYGKGAGYDVGDQDFSELPSDWNAVYVSGSWRLVHPKWMMEALQGFELGVWTKVEESGQAVRQTQQASEGVLVNTLDEFWFLTDPEVFVYFCLAEKSAWQLLRTPWSVHKFANVPHFSQEYFDCDVKLATQHASILNSIDGFMEITFSHPETTNADLNYALFFDEEQSRDQLPRDLQLELYVIHSISETTKSLLIRFPFVGIYKIEVSVVTDYEDIQLCSFRLECNGSLKNVQPFPLNPPIGYGFSSKAKDAGLTKPSHVKGIMTVKESERVTFEFQRTVEIEVQSLLVHKDTQSSELQSYIKQEDSEQNVKIVVTVPEHAQNPEYALQINTREQRSGGPFENVVNYLLTHDNKEIEYRREEGETMTEKDLRETLKKVTEGSDIESLEKVMRKFMACGFKDKRDLTRAREKLIALHEEALRQATDKRCLQDLEATIKTAECSCVNSELWQTSALKNAGDLLQRLRRFKLYLPKILELKSSTVSEIHSYKRPRPLVHNVMIATYLLLGESEPKLMNIQNLLRKQGRQNIIRLIENFDSDEVSQSSVQLADEYLSRCLLEQVRLESAGVATFFLWSRHVTSEMMREIENTS